METEQLTAFVRKTKHPDNSAATPGNSANPEPWSERELRLCVSMKERGKVVGADGLQHCLGTLTEATATKNVHEECANVNRLQLTTVIITITEWFPTPHALHSEPAGSLQELPSTRW